MSKGKTVVTGLVLLALVLAVGLTPVAGDIQQPLISQASQAHEWIGDMGCTGFTVVGKAAIDGKTRMGQNNDGTPFDYGNWKSVNLVVNPETGIKALYEHWGNMNFQTIRYYLNNCGVAMDHLARPGPANTIHESASFADKDAGYLVEVGYSPEEYPGIERSFADWIDQVRKRGLLAAEYGSGGIYASNILEYAHTAKEAVDLAIEGLPEGTYGVVEIKDAALGHSNHYMYDPYHPWNAGRDDSMARAARCQELLDLRPGTVTTPYLFTILRDTKPLIATQHGSKYTYPSGLTSICRVGYQSESRFSRVSEIHPKYTSLLSVHWMNPCHPATSPYIPFYIGITKVPPTFAHGPHNQTPVFRELFTILLYKPDYADDVQRFWEAFEQQTLREMLQLERDVAALADAGQTAKAEDLLNRFVNKKCELAVKYAKELTRIINSGLSIKDISVDVETPDRSW